MNASPICDPKAGAKLVMVTVTASSSNAKAVAKSMNFILQFSGIFRTQRLIGSLNRHIKVPPITIQNRMRPRAILMMAFWWMSASSEARIRKEIAVITQKE